MLLAFAMGLWGSTHLPTAQVILVFSWMGMLVPQFEEYAWPGGFPSIANYMGMGEIEVPERFPLNARQCLHQQRVPLLRHLYCAYLFPDLVWLAAGQVMMGLWQLPAHGIIMNKRLKSICNPGFFSTVFLQTPIAVYYIWFVRTTMPEIAWQLWWGIQDFLSPSLFPLLSCTIERKENHSRRRKCAAIRKMRSLPSEVVKESSQSPCLS